MASDSRLTLNTEKQEGDKKIIQLAVGQSDSTHKTFLAPNNIGISTYSAASIQGVPIAGYIQSFIDEHIGDDEPVDAVPQKLLDYFQKFPDPPDTQFLVAGYKKEPDTEVPPEQHVWHIAVSDGTKERKNVPGEQGARWGGEADILSRLVSHAAELNANGEVVQTFPDYPVPFTFFTLQDAIDYAKYAVQVTIDSFRFQPRAKTVGGFVDILVIKPQDAFWVQHRELHA